MNDCFKNAIAKCRATGWEATCALTAPAVGERNTLSSERRRRGKIATRGPAAARLRTFAREIPGEESMRAKSEPKVSDIFAGYDVNQCLEPDALL